MKHTPGPWHRNINANYPVYAEDDKTRFKYIAHVLSKNIGEDEVMANLNLITAAPEMLEALKFVRGFFADLEDSLPPDDPLLALRKKFHAPVHIAINAAIAKAEGNYAKAKD